MHMWNDLPATCHTEVQPPPPALPMPATLKPLPRSRHPMPAQIYCCQAPASGRSGASGYGHARTATRVAKKF